MTMNDWAKQMNPLLKILSLLLLVGMTGCGNKAIVPSENSREGWLKIHDDTLKNPKLVKETRWSLTYQDTKTGKGLHLSKFMTKEASISVKELASEWPEWSPDERQDFCNNVVCSVSEELTEILRFVVKNGNMDNWSAIALRIGELFPKDESATFLAKCLRESPPGRGSNFSQALAVNKLRDAETLIRARLERLWAHPDILAVPDHGLNQIAFEATCCIQYLQWLGVPKDELTDKAQILMKHPHQSNSDTAKNYLAESKELPIVPKP